MRFFASAFVLLLASAALGSACGGDDSAGAEGDPIALGSIFSTTGAGVAFGPQQVNGAELAVSKVNAEGGIDGKKLELIQRDDGSDPARAAELMREVSEIDEVLAVLGPTFSNSAAAAHPLTDELGITALAVSNTGPGIVGDCDYPCDLVFRNSLGEQSAIPANIRSLLASDDYVRGSGLGTAVVVHPADDPFGASSAEIARDALVEQGLVETPVLEGDGAVRQALRRDPRILMVTASSGEAAAGMVLEARQGGFEGPILGGNAFNSSVAAEVASAAGEGARSAAAWHSDGQSDENRAFVDAYRDTYGEDPDQFAAQAYTGVLLLAEAARRAPLTLTDLGADRQALAKSLAEVELETPLGPFAFTPDHDVSQPIWIVEMDGQGGHTLIEQIPSG